PLLRSTLFPYTTLFRSRNDTAVVDGLLDTDKVTADLVAQIRLRLSGSLLNSRFSDQIDSAISTRTPRLRDTVHDQFLQELHRLRSEEHTSELQSLAYLV